MWKPVFRMLAISAVICTPAFGEALEGKRSSAEILAASIADDWAPLDPDNTLYIELESGRVVVVLSAHLAQSHVEQIKTLARSGFYDGLSFYRVIDGFVAQGGLGDVRAPRDIGDAHEALTAAFDEPLSDALPVTRVKDVDGYADAVGFLGGLPVGMNKAENAGESRVWYLHCPGAIAMARDTPKNTASTEFYITLQSQRYLDRNLTVFGRVVAGMAHLQSLRRVAPAEKEGDDLGDAIVSMKVAADIPASERADLEMLRDGTATFADYVEARRNRSEDFFYFRPNHIDVCQLPYPVRERTDVKAAD